MSIEKGPKFEKVPWDESVIPPDMRKYLRKLYEDPKEVENFWSDKELEHNLKNPAFREMMDIGILALDLESPVLGEKEDDEEFNRRFHDYEEKLRNLLQSSKYEASPLQRSEIFREWFALTQDFMIKEGVPKEEFNLAKLIGGAYELEARYYDSLEIPIGGDEGVYPFEKPRDEVIRRFGLTNTEFEEEEKEEEAKEKVKTQKPTEKEILPEHEKELAERGEQYLKKQKWPRDFKRKLLRFSFYAEGSKAYHKAYDDFEEWYLERKKENDKKEK